MEDKKANVLIVHNYYQIPGGEDTVVANEMKLLADNGHQVSLYSRNNSELAKFTKLQKSLLPLMTVFNLKTYKEIRKIIREKKIDIVHVHNTLNLVSPSVYYAAKSCNVPVVQTIHNFRLLCPAATFYRDGHICEDCVQKGLFCSVKHNCYRGSKVQTLACVITTKIHKALGIYRKINYICLAEFNKDKLLMLNKPGKRKTIMPEKVFIKPNMTYRQMETIVGEKQSYYLFAGRIEAIKGMDILINAFEKIPEKQLVIAGTGTQLEAYKESVSERQLKNIDFLGFVEPSKLKNLMKGARALIVPSQWYETFGMTVIEAFSVGTPVIAADIGNLSSLIKEGINGWKFRYDSVDELIEKINLCDIVPAEQLQVQCEDVLFPEGNYKILNQIYKEIIEKT